MSRCKHCKRPIKWLQVPMQRGDLEVLEWRVFDKRKRAGEPYKPHICKKEDLPEPDPRFSRRPINPWWND